MPKILDRSISELKHRVDVVDVVGASVQLKKRGVAFKGLCPFHQEKSPSFTVNPGKGWVCFGCGAKGDMLGFVMKREGCTFVEAVERVANKFGVVLEFEQPKPGRNQETGSSAPAVSGASPAPAGANVLTLPDGVDVRTAKRAIARQANYQRSRDAEIKLENEHRRAHLPSIDKRQLAGWSDVVQQRWDVGRAALHLQDAAKCLADGRGWPEHWVHWLLDEQLVALPLPPWADKPPRQVAFRVDAPIGSFEPRESGGDCWTLRELMPVGYHQRFVMNGKKSWVYVPYLPPPENRRTDFQREMVRFEIERGATEGDSLVPGLPFFMGSHRGVRFLVVSEGQWDAVTFAGACGWLDSDTTWPEGVAVMGARGSNGVDTLLAYWGDWIGAEKPEVLVLADNDIAGRRWDQPAPTAPGALPSPTFAKKLEFAGASRVVVSRVKPELGKDFNDYWRARHPNPVAMAGWLRSEGFSV